MTRRIVVLVAALLLAAGLSVAQVGGPPGVPIMPVAGALGATNAWTGANSFFDANFSLKDDATPTKIAKFQLAGLPVGTTTFAPASAATGSFTLVTAQKHEYFVDSTGAGQYLTVKAAVDAINAEAAGIYPDTQYVVHIAPGTYSDNLTFLNEKYLRLEGYGVELSGTIAFTQTQQGGDYYSRVEFVGMDGFRAEKGPAFKISGAMTATRNNDSLTYVTFKGCWVTGAFTATTNGTWVVQFFNSRMTGTIDGNTFGTADATILLESDWTEFATGTIQNIVSLYNVRNSDFYGAINTTPWYSNTFRDCTFGGSVSIIPQGGAAEAQTYLDSSSFKALAARTPTLTGVTVVNLDLGTVSPTIPDSGDGNPAAYTLQPRGARAAFLTCADANGCTVTMGEEMAVAGQTLTIVNLAANDITLVDDDGTTAELDADSNYAMDVILENVTLVYTGTYWLQVGFLDPS